MGFENLFTNFFKKFFVHFLSAVEKFHYQFIIYHLTVDI